jgi:hypothetical protein
MPRVADRVAGKIVGISNSPSLHFATKVIFVSGLGRCEQNP